MTDHECSVRAEFDYPHKGKVRVYKIQVYTQPPGRGSFTITTTAPICAAHRKQFTEGHVNLGIGAPLKELHQMVSVSERHTNHWETEYNRSRGDLEAIVNIVKTAPNPIDAIDRILRIAEDALKEAD